MRWELLVLEPLESGGVAGNMANEMDRATTSRATGVNHAMFIFHFTLLYFTLLCFMSVKKKKVPLFCLKRRRSCNSNYVQ